jgi:Fe-Mn family superoxide dismutase
VRPIHYTPREFPFLLHLRGLPASLMAHHVGLYHGYVARLNQIVEGMRRTAAGSPEHSALRKRMSFEFDGMKLHELFFEQFAPQESFDNAPISTHPFLGLAQEQFGSIQAWRNDITDAASIPGSGWAISYVDNDTILNIKVESHEIGHLAGCIPAFVLDTWEHAYECCLSKENYIDRAIVDANWSVIGQRCDGRY